MFLSANHTLEDLDAYYRTNPGLIDIKDSDAISIRRPLKYIQHEQEEMEKNVKQGGDDRDNGAIEHAE